jgi:hypothetical protein
MQARSAATQYRSSKYGSGPRYCPFPPASARFICTNATSSGNAGTATDSSPSAYGDRTVRRSGLTSSMSEPSPARIGRNGSRCAAASSERPDQCHGLGPRAPAADSDGNPAGHPPLPRLPGSQRDAEPDEAERNAYHVGPAEDYGRIGPAAPHHSSSSPGRKYGWSRPVSSWLPLVASGIPITPAPGCEVGGGNVPNDCRVGQ